MGPGAVSRWCAVVCPWVLCCPVLLCVVPPGVVVLWAVLFPFALLGDVARCVVSWGAVRRPVVLCLRRCVLSCPPRCVCFAVVCCCLVLFPAVLCAVCVVGCRAVHSLSSPPCAVLLCVPAPPWCPAPLCCAPLCCADVWCCGVLSCCRICLVSATCKTAAKFVFIKKTFFQNKIKLYTTQRTHTRPLAGSKIMSASLPYKFPLRWWRCPG